MFTLDKREDVDRGLLVVEFCLQDKQMASELSHGIPTAKYRTICSSKEKRLESKKHVNNGKKHVNKGKKRLKSTLFN